MRKEEFKMERKELLEVVKKGEVFSVAEYELPNSYYYVLGNAYAMSGNYKGTERIHSTKGEVLEVQDTPRGYFVTVGFDE
ncbi:MAG: hypothetical protein IJ682_01490 [Lachnospiraceae bacterium]|nr:hypothetical protein [Lachnospiraceae bacterium]